MVEDNPCGESSDEKATLWEMRWYGEEAQCILQTAAWHAPDVRTDDAARWNLVQGAIELQRCSSQTVGAAGVDGDNFSSAICARYRAERGNGGADVFFRRESGRPVGSSRGRGGPATFARSAARDTRPTHAPTTGESKARRSGQSGGAVDSPLEPRIHSRALPRGSGAEQDPGGDRQKFSRTRVLAL